MKYTNKFLKRNEIYLLFVIKICTFSRQVTRTEETKGDTSPSRLRKFSYTFNINKLFLKLSWRSKTVSTKINREKRNILTPLYLSTLLKRGFYLVFIRLLKEYLSSIHLMSIRLWLKSALW